MAFMPALCKILDFQDAKECARVRAIKRKWPDQQVIAGVHPPNAADEVTFFRWCEVTGAGHKMTCKSFLVPADL